LNPGAESFAGSLKVTITDATYGATIYYTLDGSTPTVSSPVYTAPITITGTTTIQAMASASGYLQSAVTSAAYVDTLRAGTPVFSPAGGTYSSSQSVTIGDATSGATIYYTTNGSTPTTSSAIYTGAITVSATETLEAIAVEIGYGNSAVASAAYTIAGAVSAPVFSPAPGTYTSPQNVLISDTTPGAVIYYTTDGSTPTTSSPIYMGAIWQTSTQVLKAIAAETGYTNSAVTTAAYTIAPVLPPPTFSPPGGGPSWALFTTPPSVTISDSQAGTAIYYTTNGSTPTTASTRYAGPITVNATESIQAIAVESGYTNSATSSMLYSIAPALPAPTFSVAPGTYISSQTVTIGDSTAGTAIYYTTNGTTPTTASTLYTGAVTVSATESLEAIAVASGYRNSPVATAAFTIVPVLPAPTFSPAAGSYSTWQSVTIEDTTAGATIYYTTNGTTPTTASAKYTGALTLGASETLQAFAAKTGYTNSAVANAAYSIGTILPAPTFSLAAGTYTTAQTVTVSDIAPGATIYYTTNGTAPTAASAKYTGAITVAATETLQAFAAKTGYANSAVTKAAYAIAPILPAPTFSPTAGIYTTSQTVAISDAAPGTTIYYTTNGTAPTTASAKYTGAITVSAAETVQAFAAKTGYTNSTVAKAAYTIAPILPTPVFSVAAGTYTTPQTVAITDAMAGTTIYYTTNGIAPTASSTKYTSAIKVSSTETLEAIAVETGYSNSQVAKAAYSVSTGSTNYIDYLNSGFTASGLALNFGAKVTGGLLQLTDGGTDEARSAWFMKKVPVQNFITDFTFEQSNAAADGLTFAIQGKNIWSLGAPGGGLGFEGIASSVAVKFDLYNNAGEGNNSTGLYINGAAPTVPAINLGSTPINLHSGHVMHAHLVYDGTNLTMTLTDTITNAAATEVFRVNIPANVGGSTAYVGFTASTGSTTSKQNVLSWTYYSH